MAKGRAVLFLSAIFSFLLKEGLPFVLLPPSTTNLSPKALSSWAGTRGVSPTSAAVGRPARISARRGRQTTMSMADVCHGDFPTPGWVRMAQRNLARVSVGDQLPDSTVRYGSIVCMFHALYEQIKPLADACVRYLQQYLQQYLARRACLFLGYCCSAAGICPLCAGPGSPVRLAVVVAGVMDSVCVRSFKQVSSTRRSYLIFHITAGIISVATY